MRSCNQSIKSHRTLTNFAFPQTYTAEALADILAVLVRTVPDAAAAVEAENENIRSLIKGSLASSNHAMLKAFAPAAKVVFEVHAIARREESEVTVDKSKYIPSDLLVGLLLDGLPDCFDTGDGKPADKIEFLLGQVRVAIGPSLHASRLLFTVAPAHTLLK